MNINSNMFVSSQQPVKPDDSQIKSMAPASRGVGSVDKGTATSVMDDAANQSRRVDDAVERINKMAKQLGQSVGLQFSVDENTKIRVVKVVDFDSKEVLRQIPNQEVLDVAQGLDRFQGMLLNDKV